MALLLREIERVVLVDDAGRPSLLRWAKSVGNGTERPSRTRSTTIRNPLHQQPIRNKAPEAQVRFGSPDHGRGRNAHPRITAPRFFL
jgi:hypothetical protein